MPDPYLRGAASLFCSLVAVTLSTNIKPQSASCTCSLLLIACKLRVSVDDNFRAGRDKRIRSLKSA